ncbi:MAG: hypothetical protein V4510_10745 [bacterium]
MRAAIIILIATASILAVAPTAHADRICTTQFLGMTGAYACVDTEDVWNSCVHVDSPGLSIVCRGPNNPPVPQI